jgi:DNA-binding CsgD family transcriptional regulator
MEHHLARPDKTVDFNRLLGSERLERLETYNELWRPCRIERQVVGFMGTPAEPLGLVCMTRRARDRPFTVADARVLERLRRAAERALTRLRREALATGGLGVLLGALETGLPLACALFDPDGRLLWISRQALARFEADTPRFGRSRVLFDGCVEYASWRRAALESARNRSDAADQPHLRVEAPGGLRPVMVSRLGRPEFGPVVLVSALSPSHAFPPPAGHGDLRSYRLTEREAQVVMLAARGLSVLNVSARLSIAESTVRTHVKNAYRKMGVSNRAELTSRVLGAFVGLPGPAAAADDAPPGEPLDAPAGVR